MKVTIQERDPYLNDEYGEGIHEVSGVSRANETKDNGVKVVYFDGTSTTYHNAHLIDSIIQ